ncbi:MAG: hypothetical protein II542_09605 [Bacteroidales bacterium]|nr:hypothetical protein [Bacteroidales bacterium]
MRFKDIIGNDNVVKALVGMADSGRVPHALMMYENDGGGALAIALAFISYLNCKDRHDGDSCGECASCNQTDKLIFPDLRFTFPITSGTKVSGEVSKLTCDNFVPYWRELVSANPYFLENELSTALGIEKKSGVIAVAEGKAIMQKLSLSSVTDGYRCIVIWLPEKMNQQTANMLLKSIEEPEGKTVFILITHQPEAVLPTISSRCLPLRVLPLSGEEVRRTLVEKMGVTEEEASRAAFFSGGSVGFALHTLSEDGDFGAMHEIVEDMIGKMLERDYLGTLEIGEALAAMESREKQKAFCNFAGDCLRKIFMIQQKMDDIAGIPPESEAFYRNVAGRCSRSFCRKAIEMINRTSLMLDRNVSQKILFCNMVSRMYTSIV